MFRKEADNEVTAVHTLIFPSKEIHETFLELAGSADGLPVARVGD